MYTLEVLNPVATLRADLKKGTRPNRRSPLEGKTLGLISGGSVNADVALNRAADLLKGRVRDLRTIYYQGAHPTPKPVLDRAFAECDTILFAAGD